MLKPSPHDTIWDHARRSHALGSIASAQVKAGDNKQASDAWMQAAEVAQEIERADEQVRALSTLASAQVDAGDKERASTTLKQAVEVTLPRPWPRLDKSTKP